MKTKKLVALLLVVVVTLSLFAACGSTPKTDTQQAKVETKVVEPAKAQDKTEAAPAKKDNKDITIAICPKALDNPIFIDTKVAAEKAGKELGIKVDWVGSTNSVASEQVTVIEGLIAKKVDAILISCNDATALKDVINKATGQGIKIATFDSDSPDSKRLFYIGTNNYNAGKKAAEYMTKLLPNGGKVAILTGVLGAPNLEERIKGFKDAAKGSKLQVLPVQTGEDDVAKSVEIVNQFTSANPDLAGWWFDGGWPFFADEAALAGLKKFRDKGGKVVSIDTFHPMLKFMKLGYADQFIGSNYTAMGDQGVKLLLKAIQGEKLTETNVDTGYELCDKANVEEVLKSKTPWK